MTAAANRSSYSIMAAADRLGLPRSAMVELVESGTVPAYFEGWCLRIRAADLDAHASRTGAVPNAKTEKPFNPVRAPSGWPP